MCGWDDKMRIKDKCIAKNRIVANSMGYTRKEIVANSMGYTRKEIVANYMGMDSMEQHKRTLYKC